jgi:hypothetical protein
MMLRLFEVVFLLWKKSVKNYQKQKGKMKKKEKKEKEKKEDGRLTRSGKYKKKDVKQQTASHVSSNPSKDSVIVRHEHTVLLTNNTNSNNTDKHTKTPHSQGYASSYLTNNTVCKHI